MKRWSERYKHWTSGVSVALNQKAYILPFSKDKTKRLSLQIGYKAYIEFAIKSGYGLNTQIIYENDIYDINIFF